MIDKETKESIGIVLANVPYKENSTIVTFSGEEGIFSCIARDIYKPKSNLKPLLVIGNLVKIEYNSSKENVNFIKGVSIISDYSSLSVSYEKNIFLLYLQEMSLKLFSYGDAFPFEETNAILHSIKKDKNILSMSLLFLGSLYNCLGIKPNIKECVRCKNTKNIIGISFKDGGFVCNKCANNLDYVCKDIMDLYVFKYAFGNIDEDSINKIVPKENGIKMLTMLHDYLLDYFDAGKSKSFPLLLSLFN